MAREQGATAAGEERRGPHDRRPVTPTLSKTAFRWSWTVLLEMCRPAAIAEVDSPRMTSRQTSCSCSDSPSPARSGVRSRTVPQAQPRRRSGQGAPTPAAGRRGAPASLRTGPAREGGAVRQASAERTDVLVTMANPRMTLSTMQACAWRRLWRSIRARAAAEARHLTVGWALGPSSDVGQRSRALLAGHPGGHRRPRAEVPASKARPSLRQDGRARTRSLPSTPWR